MLLTNAEQLEKYYGVNRLWQGIASVEVTKKGRIFVTFYGGGVTEQIGNYSLVVMSDDGVNFSEPIAVAVAEGKRCFDPCLWIDPLERLWFTWAECPEDGAYASICENPDADHLVWSEPFKMGHNIMMNKPTVLSTGEWLFPIAVWRDGCRALPEEYDYKEEPRGARVYCSNDQGKSFQLLGTACVEPRSYDEHQIVEMQDGLLNMYVRVANGIKVAKSFDHGKQWIEEEEIIPGPCSRFHIRRLPSGRLLLINHSKVQGRCRNHLTAFLSEDEGKTWPYELLLDEREGVSYPDVAIGPDGSLYVVYDRERGANKKKWVDIADSAKEILIARITEQEILDGYINQKESYLKRIVSELHMDHEEAEKLDKMMIPVKGNAEGDEILKKKFANRKKAIEKVLEKKIIAIVRGVYGEDSLKLAEALYAGGIELMEVTFDQSKPECLEQTSDTVKRLGEQMRDRMLIGAGTVTTLEMLKLAKDAGAQFIVSPNTKKEIIQATVLEGMVSMPGALTPTEVLDAYEYGADFVKLFPIGNLGTSYMKAVCAPINHVPLLAVGGVNEKNIKEFLEVGAVGVGVGGNLVNKRWIADGEFEKITALAREYTKNI